MQIRIRRHPRQHLIKELAGGDLAIATGCQPKFTGIQRFCFCTCAHKKRFRLLCKRRDIIQQIHEQKFFRKFSGEARLALEFKSKATQREAAMALVVVRHGCYRAVWSPIPRVLGIGEGCEQEVILFQEVSPFSVKIRVIEILKIGA